MASQKQLLLPEKYSVTENEQDLTIERKLFNAIIDLCQELKLGVKAGNVDACNKVVLALRDALHLMIGRESDFKWSSVPSGLKFGLERKKKRNQPRLSQEQLLDVKSRLRGALDSAAFTQTQLWQEFVALAEAVHDVIDEKVQSMRNHSAQVVARQHVLQSSSPTMAVLTIEASPHSGTALKYSDLEQKLLAMHLYTVLSVEHEYIHNWAKEGDGDYHNAMF